LCPVYRHNSAAPAKTGRFATETSLSGDKLGLGILERLRGLTAPVRYRERRLLLGLERHLLRQHDVAGGKLPLGPEAPDGDPRAALSSLSMFICRSRRMRLAFILAVEW
jgi:hypothetical protein